MCDVKSNSLSDRPSCHYNLFPPVSFLSEQRVSRVRLSLQVAYVFASLMNWERFFRIKILPIYIHNMGNQGSRRFVWPWRRFCSLLKDCRIVARLMPFAGASIGSICYVLNWMIRVLTIQYYANFAVGYLKAERNESCSTKYYRRCVIRSW